jgi:simple sugar transport system permease protein
MRPLPSSCRSSSWAAALAGAALMLGPTLLKVRLGVDEVVTTLLLNFVVLLFVQMMLEGPFKDPMGGGWPQSEPILDAGALPPLVERMRLHAGFLIGIGLCAVLHVPSAGPWPACGSGRSATTSPPRAMRA